MEDCNCVSSLTQSINAWIRPLSYQHRKSKLWQSRSNLDSDTTAVLLSRRFGTAFLMKVLRPLTLLFSILLLISGLLIKSPRSQSNSLPKAARYVADELLVKFARNAKADERLRQLGGQRLKDFGELRWQRIRVSDASLEHAIARYRNLPEVELVQPNFIYQTQATTNDPRLNELYGLTKIQAPTAWDSTTGSQNVVVAVLDLGIDYNHEDLSANMWRNPGETGVDALGANKSTNLVDDDGNGYVDDVFGIDTINDDTNPMDDGGHGTHVAGTIGAVGNNGKGVVGVNWAVSLMAIKSHGSDGNGTSASVIEAYQYAAMMRRRGVNVRVTNSSWGGAPEAASYDQALKDAIDDAGNADILNVCAAGNGNNDNDANPFYPASYDSPSILAVAASDQNDAPAAFSSYGANSVDIAAPGVGILSTFPVANGSYTFLGGTSMAAPHVSGAAALLFAYKPLLNRSTIKSLLMSNADPLPASWAAKPIVSGGRLNVLRALQNIPITNQIDNSDFFVRQQYADFLSRDPDAGGLAFWTDEINSCGSNAACVSARRVRVSGAFFGEPEFQQTGSFVYRVYKGGLGRRPSYVEFNADRPQVMPGPNLESMKQAFTLAFVQRADFLQKYAANTTAESFVDALITSIHQASNVNLTSQRGALVSRYNAGSDLNQRRAFALREAIEHSSFTSAEYNPTFVLMQYFGYLRREPDQGGYDFWLDVINNRVPNNYISMICGFTTSAEYQTRFAPVVSRTNADCQE
jgi:subtilisin family serine protease